MRLEELIKGDDTVQRLVASERKQALLVAVSPLARKAIEKEVLPQLEEHVTSVEAVDELAEQTKKDIEESFDGKTQVYTRLIQYKSIDQSDTQFKDDLIHVMDEWARKTHQILEDGPPAKPGEVKVKIEVESDVTVKAESEVTVKTDSDDQVKTDTTEIQLQDTSSEETLPISMADIFEPGDIRL